MKEEPVNAYGGRRGLVKILTEQAMFSFTKVTWWTAQVDGALSSMGIEFVIGGSEPRNKSIGGMMESCMRRIVSPFLQVDVKL